MTRPRFSIFGLMGLVLVSGLVLAAAMRPTWMGSGALLSATAALYLAAVAGAIWGRGRRRAFWAGFALLGGGHFVLCYAPVIGPQVGPELLSTQLAERVVERVYGLDVPPLEMIAGPGLPLYFEQNPTVPTVYRLVDLAVCLLGGAAGLALGPWIVGRRESETGDRP